MSITEIYNRPATVIAIDVHCKNLHGKQPYYRLYVNDDLLTERTWIWPSYEIYIREHIEVNIESGDHYIRIKSDADFDLKNLHINDIMQLIDPSNLANSQDLFFKI